MYESEERTGLELAPETRRRLAELFAGQVCCRCSEPAARLAGNRYYCVVHYLHNHPRASAPKVYRCAVASAR